MTSQEDAQPPSSSQPAPYLTRGTSRASSTRVSSFGSATAVYPPTEFNPLVRSQAHATTLRPTSPSLLNRAMPAVAVSRKDVLAADVQRNSYPIPSKTPSISAGLGMPTAAGMPTSHGATGKNPQAVVFFEAEDFDDDDDLDFDVEDPHLKGSVPPPSMAPQPVQASQPDKATRQDGSIATHAAAADPCASTSSVPLPWSSSPVRPPAAPAPRVSFKREAAPASEHEARDVPVGEQDESDPPSKKRRTVPWKATDGTSRNQGPRGSSLVQATPARGAAHSTKPWDETASAIKEKQKRLKQSRKKLLPSIDAKGDPLEDSGKDKKRVGRVFLSDEQKAVARLVIEQEKSVFFTGSAGTGKSVLLRELIRGLQGKYRDEPDRVAVTASTGLAACNIGGVTLHSFAGIGLGKEGVKDLARKVRRNPKAVDRWRRTGVLIIDEVSMVDGELFDKLEELARMIRKNGKPFGGIQLVITGDFFQLPPVPDGGKPARFAFEAATWSTTIERKICLTQIFRQKDPVFAGMLNEMRLGKLTPKSIATFRELSRPITYKDELTATELFPTRGEVDGANGSRLRQLEGDSKVYEAIDSGAITDKVQRDRLLANCMAPASLQLKIGAQVMLIKNLDESLVNGSLGKVLGFMDEKEFELTERRGADYGILDGEAPDLDEIGPVRAKARSKFDPDAIRMPGRKWPYVRFANADGTSRSMLVQPEVWKTELPNGEVQAQRSQVPLILAWALSIHKAQGQTLERVKVDLGRIFEKGQAYVALSRATSQDGLQVLRFDPRKVMAHDKVRQFYDGLYAELDLFKQETRAIEQGSNGTAKPAAPPEPNSWSQAFDDEHEEALMSMYA